MIRTQIYLTDEEHRGISDLSRTLNMRQSELIRMALDEFLIRKSPNSRLERIRSAQGMWSDHNEIDLKAMRDDFDRFE